jgi:hypothetical protein
VLSIARKPAVFESLKMAFRYAIVSAKLADSHCVSRRRAQLGTRPDSNELRALLESQMSLLHIG